VDGARYALQRNWCNSDSMGKVSRKSVVVCVYAGLLVVRGPFRQVAGAEHEVVRVRETQQWRSDCGMMEAR